MKAPSPAVWTTGGPATLASTGCRSLDVLWLYELADVNARRSTHAAALHTLDHSLAGHRVVAWNCWHQVPKHLREARFDLIVLDHNLLACRTREDFPLRRRWFEWIAATNAVRLATPQDEYLWTSTLEDWLLELDVHVIFSAFGRDHTDRLYPRLAGKVAFEHSFTGYLPGTLADRAPDLVRPHAERPLDIVYRARQLPYSLGARAQLKHTIGVAGREAARSAGLRCDIETGDFATLYGTAWFEFLASARATLGTESGAGAIDGRGDIARREAEMRRENPDLTFASFAATMPDGWDGLPLFTIGPRHLEAAAAKTCQVLIEGDYDGVLEAEVHYIPVDEELVRLPEAMERIQDTGETQAVAERTYRDIVLSGKYSYGALAAKIESAVIPLIRRGSRTSQNVFRAHRAEARAHDVLCVRVPRFGYRFLRNHCRPLLAALIAVRGFVRRFR